MQSQPADVAGMDVELKQQEKLGLPEHPPCRATPFSTHQMENKLFGKTGWIPPVRTKESNEFCFPPTVMGIIMCWCSRLSQLSGKREVCSKQSGTYHCRVVSTAELWTLNNSDFIEIPDMPLAPNMPSCTWSWWPLFSSDGSFYVRIMIGQDWLFWPVYGMVSPALTTNFHWALLGAQQRDHPVTWVKRTPEMDGVFSWPRHIGRTGFCGLVPHQCLVRKPP